jgi:hypothetical protein
VKAADPKRKDSKTDVADASKFKEVKVMKGKKKPEEPATRAEDPEAKIEKPSSA